MLRFTLLANRLLEAVLPVRSVFRQARRQWLVARDLNRDVNGKVAAYLAVWTSELLRCERTLRPLASKAIKDDLSELEAFKAIQQLFDLHPVVGAFLANFARHNTAGQLFFLLRDAGVSLDADLPFGGRATLQAPNMLEAGFELLDENESNAWEVHCQKVSLFDL
jgi:hypothetical protein